MPARELIIDGQTKPRRRLTVWAWIYFLTFVALPVPVIGTAHDFALYTYFFS